jgi:hypothetical protein
MAGRMMGDEEMLDGYTAAAERGRVAAETEPRAASARYDHRTRRVVLELTNGCLFAFPTAIAQGLSGATREQLRHVEVMPGALDIYREELDVGFSVPNLVGGTFGSREWMRQLRQSRMPVHSPAPE